MEERERLRLTEDQRLPEHENQIDKALRGPLKYRLMPAPGPLTPALTPKIIRPRNHAIEHADTLMMENLSSGYVLMASFHVNLLLLLYGQLNLY
jgi:hypothetical protein